MGFGWYDTTFGGDENPNGEEYEGQAEEIAEGRAYCAQMELEEWRRKWAREKELKGDIDGERKKYGSAKQWDFVEKLYEQTKRKYSGTCYKDLCEYISVNKALADEKRKINYLFRGMDEREECFLDFNEWSV